MVAFLLSPGPLEGTLDKQFKKNVLTCFLTGDILKSSVSKGTESGLRVNGNFSNGIRVDDDTVNGAVFARLQGDPHDVLFDGYPRYLLQATAFDGYLSEKSKRFGLVANVNVPMSVLGKIVDCNFQPLFRSTFEQRRSH